jgi:HK97 family phage major capsid protein
MDNFENTVLEGIESIQTEQQQHMSDYSRFQKETKKAIEDFTMAKNKMNDLAEVINTMRKMNLQLSREHRLAFGDPRQVILVDEEKRLRLSAAVLRAISTPGQDLAEPVLQRLKAITGRALGEDSSPGSTLIDDQLSKEIYDTLAMYGKWNTLGVRRMGTKQTKLPIKTVRPIALVLLTEADTLTDDANKAGTSVTLEVELIACLLNVSMQLIQDSELDIAADVLNDFLEAFNYRLDFLSFAADGTANTTHGGMTGLFQFGTAANAAAGNTLVESMQLDDFVRCLTTVDSGVLTRPCNWWMHPQIMARTTLVRDANGRSIFQTALEAPTRGVGSILGYPVQLVEAAPSTNAAASKVAAFGDPNSIVVGPRTDFAFEASDHHRWNTFERSFRGTGRAGVKGRRATGSAILTTANA